MRNFIIALPDDDRIILKKGGYIIRAGNMIGINLPIDAFYDPLGGKDRPDIIDTTSKEEDSDIYEH